MGFEYTVDSPRGDGRRWQWEGDPVYTEASQGGDILDWGDVVSGRFSGADGGVPPYTGPPISRNVAELLGIPLDDPDVMLPDSDCQHGCNGACVYGGSERCNFTCHELTPEIEALFERLDRRAMEMMGEEPAPWRRV